MWNVGVLCLEAEIGSCINVPSSIHVQWWALFRNVYVRMPSSICGYFKGLDTVQTMVVVVVMVHRTGAFVAAVLPVGTEGEEEEVDARAGMYVEHGAL